MRRQFAVIGLGNFGSQLALELARRGAEVLAIDGDAGKLDAVKDEVAHTVRLDATDKEALAEQRLAELDAVVVSFGEDFEAAVLTTILLRETGVRRIIVRAVSERHERILQMLGVNEVVLPISEAVTRLSTTLMLTGVVDSFALSRDDTIAELAAPESVVDRTVGEVRFREQYGLLLVTIRRVVKVPQLFGLLDRTEERILGVLPPEARIERGDTLIVFGPKKAIEKLAG
ncbi:TrkA family potassium uptake protein [Acidobacteria bacterium ACD]|nr:MAG: TrkA family potassium uptake protein [Acidobacteriota bacterium]MCE7956584.1 TrkA family potassium uptake protein [Acidobacteria bacterium ACB2]MDL1949205.1 TrkA family potassium uptake protein [Acidobacteria bacterium ACD]